MTAAVSFRSAGLEAKCPPFKFGSELTNVGAPSPSILSLEECFTESPQCESFPTPDTVTAKPKSSSRGPAAQSCVNGSPLTGHVRRACGPYQRPRKQFRRSLSMFEHPADVLNQQKAEQGVDTALQSIMDIDEAPALQLPHFFAEDDSIPRITKETMIDVLDGKYKGGYDQSLIVDCRFEYEYKGGHIEGAVNFNNKEELASKLFERSPGQKTLLIFHCEYSAHRAPIA
jgi:M-phase inducer tyrosine phosphatase